MKKKFIKTACFTMAAACVLSSALTFSGSAAEKTAVEDITGTDTLYSVGSVSKVYVTAAVMQLVDKGLVSLDEPITTYIPEFEMADERYKKITVRMLMNHSSGIMGTTNINCDLIEDNVTNFYDDFLNAFKNQRLKSEPGDISIYCNDGFELLEFIVVRVSGMDFTDYVAENIVKPMNCIQTGTFKSAFMSPYQAKIYNSKKLQLGTEYFIGIGEGGMLSTAAETCRFGSTFFKGDNTLLSEDSKEKMANDETNDKYQGSYGLGWDFVDLYDDSGVKVVCKGGDIVSQHSELLVAPDEKISVAVCSSGGSSSMNMLLAKSLMDIALEEQGVEVKEKEKVRYETVDTIPEEFKAYEGYYDEEGTIIKLEFPDMKYMQMSTCDENHVSKKYYKYTTDGCFVCMLGDVPNGSNVQDSECKTVNFRKRDNGKTYIISEEHFDYPMLGEFDFASYESEKIEPFSPPAEAVEAWKARCGRYYLMSEKYSSANYLDVPSVTVKMSEAEGYIHTLGTNKIVDKDHVQAFASWRDISDVTAKTEDGKDYIYAEGSEMTFISENSMEEFTADMTEINFDKSEAKWFIIDKEMGGSTVSFDRTDKTSVYVYDKYDTMIYSSYYKDFENKVPFPKQGKILFVGESGEKVNITKLR